METEEREGGCMDSLSTQQVVYEAQRMQANKQELVERIAWLIREDGRVEPLEGLHLHRSSFPTEPVHSVSKPAFCVIAQGSKEVFLGDERYQYDPAHYLLTTVELPVVSQVLEASQQQPYLSARVQLDPALVGSVLVEADLPSLPNHSDVKAMDVSPLDASLLDAILRLVRLVESPARLSVYQIDSRIYSGTISGMRPTLCSGAESWPRAAKANRSNGGVTSVVARVMTIRTENKSALIMPFASPALAITSATSPRETIPTPIWSDERWLKPLNQAPTPPPTIFVAIATITSTTVRIGAASKPSARACKPMLMKKIGMKKA